MVDRDRGNLTRTQLTQLLEAQAVELAHAQPSHLQCGQRGSLLHRQRRDVGGRDRTHLGCSQGTEFQQAIDLSTAERKHLRSRQTSQMPGCEGIDFTQCQHSDVGRGDRTNLSGAQCSQVQMGELTWAQRADLVGGH